jgi:DNA-binding PadR family transcriptional regulator
LEERLGELGFDGMRPEMYQALWQMEWEGMVLCDHEGDGLRLPGWYEITEAGESYLEFWADSMLRYQEEIDLFFKLYTQRRVRGAHG